MAKIDEWQALFGQLLGGLSSAKSSPNQRAATHTEAMSVGGPSTSRRTG
jgi:hypothetical protein